MKDYLIYPEGYTEAKAKEEVKDISENSDKLIALEAWVKVLKREIIMIIECSKECPELDHNDILDDIRQEIDRPLGSNK